MIIIYKAGNLSEAHIVAGMLNSRGIEAVVGGHYLQGGVGDLAVMDFTDVRVADEDAEAAREIINEYEGTKSPPESRPEKRGSRPIVKLGLFLVAVLLTVWLALILR